MASDACSGHGGGKERRCGQSARRRGPLRGSQAWKSVMRAEQQETTA
jgi:hypothetical protein